MQNTKNTKKFHAKKPRTNKIKIVKIKKSKNQQLKKPNIKDFYKFENLLIQKLTRI